MFRAHLRMAFRQLTRDRLSAAINVAGLAVGVASCLSIGAWVRHELSFDRFHDKAERTYRLLERDPEIGAWQVVPAPVGPLVESSFPEIESVVRFTRGWPLVTVHAGGEPGFVEAFYFVEPSFYDVFDFALVSGRIASAPYEVVLTESTARQYFGQSAAIGRTIHVNADADYLVTGVLADFPSATHVRMDMLASYETLRSIPGRSPDSWRMGSQVYVVLAPASDAPEVQAKLSEFVGRNTPESRRLRPGIELQPIGSIHLHSQNLVTDDMAPPGDPRAVVIFSTIGLLILVVASLNYVNLAAARALPRLREISIRRAVGADRTDLVAQFLAEAVLMSVAAFAAASVLFAGIRPWFEAAAAIDIGPVGWNVVASMVLAALGIGLATGVLPALRLSGLGRPLAGALGRTRHGWLARSLIALQFCVTIALVAASLVVSRQMRFIQSSDPGFRPDRVLVLSMRHSVARTAADRFGPLKDRLTARADVESVSFSSDMLLGGRQGGGSIHVSGSTDEPFYVDSFEADDDFIATVGLELVAGRAFDDRRAGDAAAVILNEEAARRLGAGDPIGREIDLAGFDPPTRRVIGVVRDFHHRSMHEAIRPSVLTLKAEGDPDYHAAIRFFGPIDEAELSSIRDMWRAVVPEVPFEAELLGTSLQTAYRADRRMGRMLGAFSLIAIAIACLGLFGLAAFATERRTKEIGIRRVLGARPVMLVALLSREFVVLVAASFVVAAPVAWVLGLRWLDGFAYRAEPSPGPFLAAGAVALLAALVAVAARTIRAAGSDPVSSLRHE